MQDGSTLKIIAILVVATALESGGDAVLRIAIQGQGGLAAARIGLFALGAMLVVGYGTVLNLAPIEFERVVGLYIATLFLVWQATGLLFFRTVPSLPTVAGGTLIVAGGAIVSLWRA